MNPVLLYFSRLFGFKYKQSIQSETDVVESVILKFLKDILLDIPDIQIKIIKSQNLRNLLDNLKKSYFAIIYNNFITPDLCCFYPEETAKFFKDQYNIQIISILNKLNGNRVNQNVILSSHLLNERIIVWKSFNKKVYQIIINGSPLYFYVNDDFIMSLKDNNSDVVKIDKNETSRIFLGNFSQFYAGNFLLPFNKLLRVKNNIIESRIKDFFLTLNINDFFTSEAGSVLLIIEINKKKFFILYLLTTDLIDFFKKSGINIRDFFTEILKNNLAFIRELIKDKEIKIGINYLNTVNLNILKNKRLLVYNSDLIINSEKYNCNIIVSIEFIIYILNFLEPEEKIKLNEIDNDVISANLLLNEIILAKKMDSFINNLVDYSKIYKSTNIVMPFYIFLKMCTENDLKIIVQNFLVTAFRIEELLNLFYIKIVNFKNQEKIIKLDFDLNLIRNLLPGIKKEDMELSLLNIISYEFDNFFEFNKRVYHRLFYLIDRNKIILSEQANFFLVKGYKEVIENQYKIELNELIEQNIPVDNLHKLSEVMLSILLNKINQKTLCFILIFYPQEKEYINKFLSKNKISILMDDLSFYRSGFNKGHILYKDIVYEYKKINDKIIDLLNDKINKNTLYLLD